MDKKDSDDIVSMEQYIGKYMNENPSIKRAVSDVLAADVQRDVFNLIDTIGTVCQKRPSAEWPEIVRQSVENILIGMNIRQEKELKLPLNHNLYRVLDRFPSLKDSFSALLYQGMDLLEIETFIESEGEMLTFDRVQICFDFLQEEIQNQAEEAYDWGEEDEEENNEEEDPYFLWNEASLMVKHLSETEMVPNVDRILRHLQSLIIHVWDHGSFEAWNKEYELSDYVEMLDAVIVYCIENKLYDEYKERIHDRVRSIRSLYAEVYDLTESQGRVLEQLKDVCDDGEPFHPWKLIQSSPEYRYRFKQLLQKGFNREFIISLVTEFTEPDYWGNSFHAVTDGNESKTMNALDSVEHVFQRLEASNRPNQEIILYDKGVGADTKHLLRQAFFNKTNRFLVEQDILDSILAKNEHIRSLYEESIDVYGQESILKCLSTVRSLTPSSLIKALRDYSVSQTSSHYQAEEKVDTSSWGVAWKPEDDTEDEEGTMSLEECVFESWRNVEISAESGDVETFARDFQNMFHDLQEFGVVFEQYEDLGITLQSCIDFFHMIPVKKSIGILKREHKELYLECIVSSLQVLKEVYAVKNKLFTDKIVALEHFFERIDLENLE